MFGLICLAIAIGMSCGAAIVGLIWLRRGNQVVHSFIAAEQLIGAYGMVEIPFAGDDPGKVCVHIGDSVIKLRAFACDGQRHKVSDRVVVVIAEENYVRVISEESLYPLAPTEYLGSDIDPLLSDCP